MKVPPDLQPDLFGVAPEQADEPEAFARATDPGTSHEAAASIAPKLAAREALVTSAVRRAGNHGRTIDELTDELGLDKVTISPRMRPLCKKGAVKEGGEKRPGKSGRSQTVWVPA